jgi:hypothetical protein
MSIGEINYAIDKFMCAKFETVGLSLPSEFKAYQALRKRPSAIPTLILNLPKMYP